MTFEFELREDLPPLSWCARARPGASVRVRHGSSVETRAEGFVEGAWDGQFEKFDFDRSFALAGSGARVRGDRVVFAAPFHPLERLFVLRRSGETLLSNSLVFLMAEAGLDLDLSYPNYYFDFLHQIRRGIGDPPTCLRTASDERIELYPCSNLEWRQDGSIQRVRKPEPQRPDCYADYFRMLLDTARALAANAASPGRGRTYRLVASCSRGYDSTASAALVSQAGCKEGLTFTISAHPVGNPITGITEEFCDDSGADSLRALGMDATEFDKTSLDRIPGHPSAEFYVNFPGSVTDAYMRLWEDQLRGSILVTGRHGERFWGPRNFCRCNHIREVDDCLLAGHGLTEFRLRTGFLSFPLPYLGAVHAPAIFRITQSPEMKPWKLGTGLYDRPIARRLAEEAGVPRENFGQKKMGVGQSFKKLRPESERDFQDFLRSEVPLHVRQHLNPRPLGERVPNHRRLIAARARTHLPLVARGLDLLGTDRLHLLWNSVYLYHFHWGFEQIRNRYAVD